MIEAAIDDSAVQELLDDIGGTDDGTSLTPLVKNGKQLRMPGDTLPGFREGRDVPLTKGGRLLKSTGRE